MKWPTEMMFDPVVMTLSMSNDDDLSVLIAGHSTGDNSNIGPRGDYDVLLSGRRIGWLNLIINTRNRELSGRLILEQECPQLRANFSKFIIEVEQRIRGEYRFNSSYFEGPFD